MAIYKVFPTTDGRFAICTYTKVNSRIGIWSPINEKRFPSSLAAELSLAGKEETPTEGKKPEIPNSGVKKLPRTSFRYTKLEKGVVVVEQYNGGKWQTVATKKTVTKAEEYINTHSYDD